METITLTQLKENFNIVLEISINKKYTIENEINAITDYINSIPNYKLFQKPVNADLKNKNNKIFKIKISDLSRSLFSDTFNNYMLVGKQIVERFHSDTDEMFEYKERIVNQAYEFADYYKWLNELLATPQKTEKKGSLTHKQKLLALHYLGLDTSKFENSKTAKILSEILELSEDNTRQYLSYISAGKNEVRTKANLEKVNQLFENQGLLDISSNIKKDLEKL